MGRPVRSTRTETNLAAFTIASVKVSFGGSDAGVCAARPNGFSAGAWRIAMTAGSLTRAGGAGVGVGTATSGAGGAAPGTAGASGSDVTEGASAEGVGAGVGVAAGS